MEEYQSILNQIIQRSRQEQKEITERCKEEKKRFTEEMKVHVRQEKARFTEEARAEKKRIKEQEKEDRIRSFVPSGVICITEVSKLVFWNGGLYLHLLWNSKN